MYDKTPFVTRSRSWQGHLWHLDPYQQITWLLKIERIFCPRKLFAGSNSFPEKSLQKNRSIFGLKNRSCYRRYLLYGRSECSIRESSKFLCFFFRQNFIVVSKSTIVGIISKTMILCLLRLDNVTPSTQSNLFRILICFFLIPMEIPFHLTVTFANWAEPVRWETDWISISGCQQNVFYSNFGQSRTFFEPGQGPCVGRAR